ncbi:MAG: hypothetical protein SH848_06260 [Saprospiraceae bacterium]|nr:hypothetical protein [Saprospiraceae bacterium]MDZ4703510.1 hypothetical protein [Saprospiraceae bacterium]
MRKLFMLFSFLCAAALATAQNYYAVRVGSFVDVRPQDFDAIRPFGFVYAIQADANLYDIHIGAFEDRITAEKTLIEVKRKGYANSSVIERFPSEGVTITIIQLGVSAPGKVVDWQKFTKAGDLYVIAGSESLKIATGTFPDMETARQRLAALKKAGFPDAFIRSVNSIFLHKAGDFETGIKKPLIPLVFEEAPKTPQSRTTTPPVQRTDTRPATQQPINQDPYGKEPPRNYEENSGWMVKSPQLQQQQGGMTAKGAVEAQPPVSKAAAMPKIRANIKRRSALELQKTLKESGTYKSDLDGYYGGGTASAFQSVYDNNRVIQKYRLLAEHSGTKSGNRLQQTINNIPTDGLASRTLETFNEPAALAYRAYLLFRSFGPDKQVNNLMNNALRGAYSGKKMKGRLPFDYNATYAYEDFNQLVLHLYYIHSAPANVYAAPCWLKERHPSESATAQSIIADYSDVGFALQACDQLSNWETIAVLEAIAADLNAGEIPNAAVMAAATSRRAQLSLSTKALTDKELKETENWNARTWVGLNGWATRDPLNQQMVAAFKVLFFQSQVLLEDYYMDRGLKAEDAKGLALATLKTLVGPYVERFV